MPQLGNRFADVRQFWTSCFTALGLYSGRSIELYSSSKNTWSLFGWRWVWVRTHELFKPKSVFEDQKELAEIARLGRRHNVINHLSFFKWIWSIMNARSAKSEPELVYIHVLCTMAAIFRLDWRQVEVAVADGRDLEHCNSTHCLHVCHFIHYMHQTH